MNFCSCSKLALPLNLYRKRLIWFLPLLLCLASCERVENATNGIHQSSQVGIADEDYCFEIRSLGKSWRMLPEEHISTIVPNALAGAVHVQGTWGSILAEPISGMDVNTYAEITMQNFKAKGIQPGNLAPVSFAQKEAVVYSAEGSLNGTPFLYQNTVFLHQGFAYQVLCWGMQTQFNPELANEFRKSFSLLKGDVIGRSSLTVVPDHFGVGYRVQDNKLQSVVSKMVVTPSNDWLLLTGDELWKTHPHAEFGLKHVKEELYLVVVPEEIDDLSVDLYTELNVYNLEKILGNLGSHKRSLIRFPGKIAGRDLEFTHYSLERGNLPMQWFLGVFSEGGKAYQILGWSLGEEFESIFKKIQSAGQFINFLSDNEVIALQKELQKRHYLRDDVGINWSFRNGHYKDFDYYFSWKQSKANWLLKAGKAAYAENEDSRISCRELVSNLRMQVIPEKACCTGLEEFHKNVSRTLLGDSVEAIEIILDEHDALESNGLVQDDLYSNQFKIVSTIRNGNAYQIVFWGLPGIMQKNRELIQEALAGFEFPKTLKIQEKTPASFLDHRMGYSLKIPGEWEVTENTPRHIQDFGSGVMFSNANQNIQVMAFNSRKIGQNVDFFISNLIQSSLRANFASFTFSKPKSREVEMGDQKWKERYWYRGDDSVSFLSTQVGSTAFIVSLGARNEDGKALLSTVQSGFQFLE